MDQKPQPATLTYEIQPVSVTPNVSVFGRLCLLFGIMILGANSVGFFLANSGLVGDSAYETVWHFTVVLSALSCLLGLIAIDMERRLSLVTLYGLLLSTLSLIIPVLYMARAL